MIFKDRQEAGKLLAEKLNKYAGKDTVILAVPRGGVVVAAEVAKRLKVPLDLIIIRKLGAPGNSELAIGANSSGGSLVLDKELISKLKISSEYIKNEHQKQLLEAKRREKVFRFGRKPLKIFGKTIILIDDGLATGSTIMAAITTIKQKSPKKIILAVPVAPLSTVKRIEPEVDSLIVLNTPENFYAIGQFYSYFPQVADDEVIGLLNERKSPLEES